MSTAVAFGLTISIILSAFFGHYFLQRYTEVTKQLKEENTLRTPLTGLLNRTRLKHPLLAPQRPKNTKRS